jgi:hypothetical protein
MGPRTIPEISPENLEKILEHLPGAPEFTKAELSPADFDYTDVLTQVMKYLGISKISGLMDSTLTFKDLPKEAVLKMYKDKTKKLYWQSSKWLLEEDPTTDYRVKVEVTPTEININYFGKEPEYISELRKALDGTGVKLNIEVN